MTHVYLKFQKCLWVAKKKWLMSDLWYVSEISNEYSKRWVDSSHTHNFCYLYAYILILISYSHYSYSKFEVLIVLMLNNTHDIVDFDSPWLNVYKNHKIIMIRIRTLQYSVEGCVFALLAIFVFFLFLLLFFVNATTTKTVNFAE